MLDAYVIGHGLPELAAALELAEVGLRVRVAMPVEAANLGAAGAAQAAGQADAAPDRGELDPDGAIRALLQHVAAPIADGEAFAGAEPVACKPGRTLLRGVNGEWQPLPEPNVWGLPAVPMSSDSIALLGGRGALRASVDRVRPVLTIGKTHALGALVRSRMGQQVLDRVVDPLVRERFGVSAADVDVAVAAPGLNGALTMAGSLSGAVLTEAEAYVARETLVRPAGGWVALRAALIARLELYGVQLGAGVADVAELTEAAGGGAGAAAGHATTPRWRVREATGETFDTASVIVGIAGIAAGRGFASSLGTADAGTEAQPAATRAVFTTVVDTAGVPEDLALAAETETQETAAAGGRAARGSGSKDSGSAVATTAGSDSERSGPVSNGAKRGVAAVERLAQGWSVRYEQVAPDQWRVTAAGPALPGSSATPAEAVDAGEVAAVRSAVPALANVPMARQLAPWAQIDARDAAAEALAAERTEHEWLVRVGRGVHAGNLAAAVADARQASVHLRRRLTGISE